MHKRPWLWLMIIPLGFFLWGIFSLNSYGVNNDEPFHFTRGQAYLNLYLTGSRTYDNLSGFNNWAKANNAAAADLDVASVKRTGTRFSAYQNPTPAFSAETLMTSDVGHPPLPDILAAASNKLFYQNLGWLGDVPSYHLFEISIATLGVILVVGWAYLEFGLVAAVIAGLALALHPMYLGESRFNIKDPAETVFFAATIFSAWFVIRLNSRKGSSNRQLIGWLLMTGAMFACAIDTKFNAFFVLPILGLWFAFSLIFSRIYQSAEDKHPFKSTLKQWLSPVMLVGYLLIAIVAVVLVYIGWPNLWGGHAISYLKQVMGFYQQLGAGTEYTPQFVTKAGWNLYPLLDVIFRAPLETLILLAVGMAGFVRYWRKPQFATLLLWTIWLIVPILRVSVPGSSLYGATRQIMEYIPAMALLAGVGGQLIFDALQKHWNKKFNLPTIVITLLSLCYLPIVVNLVRLNPNPQLFYNSLIGGLNGAYSINFPNWNNTMSNGFVAGMDWMNKNAEPNAKLALVFELRSALPPDRLRSDIQFNNANFSGPLQEGEYIMELTPLVQGGYIPKYIERTLDPVYTYSVDGVPLLRIWKNDAAHSYLLQKSMTQIQPVSSNTDGISVTFDFGKIFSFEKFEFLTSDSAGCASLTSGTLSISIDNKRWERLEDLPSVAVNRPQFQLRSIPDFLMANERARYVSITPNANACLLHNGKILGWVEQ